MLDWIAEKILAIAAFIPPLLTSDEEHFMLIRTMFALLFVVLIVGVLAMPPFRSVIGR
ncbi:MAG: hypothetical protein WCC81_02340 [Pseudolabrys sp.]|jgi:hypothetical protein